MGGRVLVLVQVKWVLRVPVAGRQALASTSLLVCRPPVPPIPPPGSMKALPDGKIEDIVGDVRPLLRRQVRC